MTSSATPLKRRLPLSFDVLRERDFVRLLLTRLAITMALQSQAVIVGWQIYSLTRDPFMLGLTGLAEALPAIACAFFAGHIVDISRPHRVYLLAVSLLFANTFLLWLFAGGHVNVPHHYLVTLIFIGIFIGGVARSFLMPASFALLPQLVKRTEIPAASAWLTSGFQIAAIGGPAIAGILYAAYGAPNAWLMPVTLISLSVLLLFGMSKPRWHYRSNEKREPALVSIKAGWVFLLQSPVLLSVMALDMFAVLFGGAVAMLPAYADQILHVGSEGLGALRAAPAMGAILTTLFLAFRPFKTVRADVLLYAVAGFGVTTVLFGLSTNFTFSMAMLIFSGAFDSVSMVMRSTLLQWLTPDAMRGRVSAVGSMFIISSNEIGAFESGLAARLIGLVPSVVFGGIGTLVVVGATSLISPKLRRLVIRFQEAQGAND